MFVVLPHRLALELFVMSRPWKRPRSSSFHEYYGRADDRTRPKRPVILYVDLHEIPDLLHRLLCPEAFQLTHDNTPGLTEQEEASVLTYMDFFRYEALDDLECFGSTPSHLFFHSEPSRHSSRSSSFTSLRISS